MPLTFLKPCTPEDRCEDYDRCESCRELWNTYFESLDLDLH